MERDFRDGVREDIVAFLAKKAEVDTLLKDLRMVSDNHFGVDPEDERMLWPEIEWLDDIIAILRKAAEQCHNVR